MEITSRKQGQTAVHKMYQGGDFVLKPGKRYVEINGKDVPMEEIPEDELEEIKEEFVRRVIKSLGGKVTTA